MNDSSSIKRDLYDCLETLRQPDADMVDPYAVLSQYGLVSESEARMPDAMRRDVQQAWDDAAHFLDEGFGKEEWALADQAFEDYTNAFYALHVLKQKIVASLPQGLEEEDYAEEENPFRLYHRLEKLMTSLVTRGMVRIIEEQHLPCGQNSETIKQYVGKVICCTLDAYEVTGLETPMIYPTKEQAITPDHLVQLIQLKPREYSNMVQESLEARSR